MRMMMNARFAVEGANADVTGGELAGKPLGGWAGTVNGTSLRT